MHFMRYADSGAALVNADLTDTDALLAHISERTWLHPSVTERDAPTLRTFARTLRGAFDAAAAGDTAREIEVINTLLAKHRVTPMISDHSGDGLHLHIANRSASVADLVMGEVLLGLATVVVDLGPDRLGVCADAKCDRVFVDSSGNHSRRYCSERCATRANVAAHRARKKAEAAGAAT